MSTAYDVVVLGGGPAGLAAIAYGLHAKLNVALVSPDLGGKVSYPFALRNHPPIEYVWGAGLTREFADMVSKDLQNHIQDTAMRVEKLGNGMFRVQLSSGDSIEARAIIVCTGVRAQRLFVAGESEYWGRGLSYSAVSHAPLFQGSNVAILGGGQRAITAARILTPLAEHIDYIVARPQQMSEGDNGEQWFNHPKITVFRGWEVQQVIGDEFVTGIDLVGLTGEVRSLSVEGVFVEFGLLPNNGAVRELVALDHNGHIVIDQQCATNIPGLFAAGDVTTVCAEQVVVSLGEGAKAALSAWQYLAFQSE
jgi:thioredoxin reductase